MLGERDRDVCAEGVERAVGEVDDTTDAENQREPKRDQEVIAPENEAIHHLFEQEHVLSQRPTRSQDADHDRPRPTSDHKLQGFCSRVGASTSSGSFAPGTAPPSAIKSHRSLAWPFALTVNG